MPRQRVNICSKSFEGATRLGSGVAEASETVFEETFECQETSEDEEECDEVEEILPSRRSNLERRVR